MKLTSENPFYGKEAMLSLYNSLDGKGIFTESMLDRAWEEVKGDLELRKGFWSLVFAIGDITDRQHSIFEKKVQGGGYAKRNMFHTVLDWMRTKHRPQYMEFMSLIVEYTGWDSLLANRVRTKKKTDKVVDVVSALHTADLDNLAAFIAAYITSEKNSYKLSLLAKRLVRIDNRTPKSDEAKYNRSLMSDLYDNLSNLMGWEIARFKNGNYAHIGLYKWRQKYIKGLEYYLFSTGEITDMGREEFLNWLDSTPSTARYRVKRRLDQNEKWADLKAWYEQWEDYKEEKQKEARKLAEAVRQGVATEEQKAKLKEVSKEAKVTVGARNLKSELEALITGTNNATSFNILADSILSKMEFKQKVLVIADCSGSMDWSGNRVIPGMRPYDVASLLTTIVGLKNPSNVTDNVFFKFGTHAELIQFGSKTYVKKNRFEVEASTRINYLVDREDNFLSNYNRVREVLYPTMGNTNINTVAEYLKNWAVTPEDKEVLQTYPVMLVISDGEFNNRPGAKASVAQFMSTMRQIGWEGVLAIWDVASNGVKRNDFTDIPNVVHLTGWSTSNINQIFTNIHDLDVIDAYTPLQSFARSDRYAPVRAKTI